MFGRWGRFVYRFRWATLVVSGVLLGLSVAGLMTGGTLAGNGGFGATLPAGETAKLISDEIRAQQAPGGSNVTLIFSSRSLAVTDPAFQSALESAVTPLIVDPRVRDVKTPYTVPAIQQSSLISKDSHQALVFVDLKDDSVKAQVYVNQLVGEVHPGSL